MNSNDVNLLVDEMVRNKRSVDEIIDELANRKCLYPLVEFVFIRKKIIGLHELRDKVGNHEYYSSQLNSNNPFNDEFIRSINDID